VFQFIEWQFSIFQEMCQEFALPQQDKRIAPRTAWLQAGILFCGTSAKKIAAVEREERSTTPVFLPLGGQKKYAMMIANAPRRKAGFGLAKLFVFFGGGVV
jgi:hypothetical protein